MDKISLEEASEIALAAVKRVEDDPDFTVEQKRAKISAIMAVLVELDPVHAEAKFFKDGLQGAYDSARELMDAVITMGAAAITPTDDQSSENFAVLAVGEVMLSAVFDMVGRDPVSIDLVARALERRGTHMHHIGDANSRVDAKALAREFIKDNPEEVKH